MVSTQASVLTTTLVLLSLGAARGQQRRYRAKTLKVGERHKTELLSVTRVYNGDACRLDDREGAAATVAADLRDADGGDGDPLRLLAGGTEAVAGCSERVVVIGGGFAGLAAARDLLIAGHEDVTVVEVGFTKREQNECSLMYPPSKQ